MRRLNIRLGDDDYDRLATVADALGVSLQKLTEELLTEGLGRRLEDAAVRDAVRNRLAAQARAFGLGD